MESLTNENDTNQQVLMLMYEMILGGLLCKRLRCTIILACNMFVRLCLAAGTPPKKKGRACTWMCIHTNVVYPHMLSCLVQAVLRCPLRRFTLILTHTHAQTQIHIHACYTHATHGAFVAVCAPIPEPTRVVRKVSVFGAQQCSAPHFAPSRRRVCVSVVFACMLHRSFV